MKFNQHFAGVSAAIGAGIAVGLLGEASMKPGLTALDRSTGFPTMPSSHLVLDCRRDFEPVLAEAMRTAIHMAFENAV